MFLSWVCLCQSLEPQNPHLVDKSEPEWSLGGSSGIDLSWELQLDRPVSPGKHSTLMVVYSYRNCGVPWASVWVWSQNLSGIWWTLSTVMREWVLHWATVKDSERFSDIVTLRSKRFIVMHSKWLTKWQKSCHSVTRHSLTSVWSITVRWQAEDKCS